eukprot:SAG22_NODE_523_length_9482_cov_4.992548_12_plen_123_part_00
MEDKETPLGRGQNRALRPGAPGRAVVVLRVRAAKQHSLETTNIEPKTSLLRAEHRRIASSDLPSTPSRLPDGCGDHPRPGRSLAPVAPSATVTLRSLQQPRGGAIQETHLGWGEAEHGWMVV